MPICDDNGGMLNDPVTIKLAEDHYWLSIADGDLLQFLWAWRLEKICKSRLKSLMFLHWRYKDR